MGSEFHYIVSLASAFVLVLLVLIWKCAFRKIGNEENNDIHLNDQISGRSNNNRVPTELVDPLPLYSPPENLRQVQASIPAYESTSVQIQIPQPSRESEDQPPKYQV